MKHHKPLNLRSNNLKNDFERFLFHAHMTFTYLEDLVDDWKPKNKKYKNLDALVWEFCEYYTANIQSAFPENHLEDLRSIIGKKKDMLF